jgi:hypothetical protein
MDLLGVELARIARLDDGGGILKHLGPVETAPEDLACQGACRGMVATLSTVNVSDQHAAFLGGDALKCNSIWALAVQISLEDVV